jgi:hypothetical protein
MRFNIDHIGDNYGKYEPMDDDPEIFLGTIWDRCKKENVVSEQYVIAKTMEIIIHESYHELIDPNLEDPDEIDDHKIYHLLYN